MQKLQNEGAQLFKHKSFDKKTKHKKLIQKLAFSLKLLGPSWALPGALPWEPGILWGALEPSWAVLGALLTAPKSRSAEKPKTLTVQRFHNFLALLLGFWSAPWKGSGPLWGASWQNRSSLRWLVGGIDW